MDRLLTGIGDGCDNCLSAPSTWSDIAAIDAGFAKDRSLESLRQVYDDLEKNARGEIKKVTGDYESRQGICSKPITLRETFSFTITHKVIHIVVWVLLVWFGMVWFEFFLPYLFLSTYF